MMYNCKANQDGSVGCISSFLMLAMIKAYDEVK